MAKASRPVFLQFFGARGEGILAVIRRLGLGGATPESTDAQAIADYTQYIIDNFDGTDLAEVLAAAAIAQEFGSIFSTPFDEIRADNTPVVENWKWLNSVDGKAYIYTDGMALAYTPRPGQYAYVASTDRVYKLVAGAWKMQRGKRIETCDFDALDDAFDFATTAGGHVIISDDVALTGSLVVDRAVRSISFEGSIDLGNFDLTLDFNVIKAGPEWIFKITGTGRVLGTMLFDNAFVEWFGADPTRTVDAALQTRTRKAFQFWADHAAQSRIAGSYVIQCPGEYRSDDVGVVIGPDIGGRALKFVGNPGATNYDFNPAVYSFAFTFERIVGGGGCTGFTFAGGSNAAAGFFDIVGCVGVHVEVYYSSDLGAARAVRFHNRDATMFTEFCTAFLSIGHPSLRCAVEYFVTSGSNSFHGSGIVAKNGQASIINFYAGLESVRLTGNGATDAHPYDAPMHASWFPLDNPGGGALGPSAVDAVVFSSTNVGSFDCGWISGHVGVEMFNSGKLTLGAGSNGMYLMPDYEIFGAGERFYVGKINLVRSIRRQGGAGNALYEPRPLEGQVAYGSAPVYVVRWKGSTGALRTWQVDVDVQAANGYHNRRLLHVWYDGLAGTWTVDVVKSPTTVNTGAYGDPAYTADATGLKITNANYNGNAVFIGAEAYAIGKAYQQSEHGEV